MESRKADPLDTFAKRGKPKAYQSPLWAHLDELRKWRRAQETWETIADKLFVQYGLKVTFQAVHAFFKRATRRGLRRPLGLRLSHQNPKQLKELLPSQKRRTQFTRRRWVQSEKNNNQDRRL